jgi:DNA-binding transcriptional LysR family regulator
VCASPRYIRERGKPRVPGDIATHNCLMFRIPPAIAPGALRGVATDEQVQVRGKLRAKHSETLREAALAGLGFILVPTWLIGGELAQRRLRAVRIRHMHGITLQPLRQTTFSATC